MSQISNASTDDNQNLNQRIKFTFPWIATIPQNTDKYGDGDSLDKGEFWINYKFEANSWYFNLSKSHISISTYTQYSKEDVLNWNVKCLIFYKMYLDNEMENELYSSERISTELGPNSEILWSAKTFLPRFSEAVKEKKISKMKISFELELPLKYFLRPFEMPYSGANEKACEEYPPDMMNDFRFEFLESGNYIFKCLDGSVRALKMSLLISSGFMNKHFKQTNDNELIVEHKLDVVKPVIIYLHTRCFEIPSSYDIDFAKRLLATIDFFKPDREIEIRQTIHYLLCQKFVEETPDFPSILQWSSLAERYVLPRLSYMIESVIVDKYYETWNKLFPKNERNSNNPKFVELFGPHKDLLFRNTDRIFEDSKKCSYILL